MNLNKETYDKIAEDWHAAHKTDDWWVEGTDRFISMLSKNATVLDAGCGSGMESKYLSDQGLQVTGIDFSESMISIAKRELPKGEFFVLDMAQAAELDREFDAIFAQASLLHIPKKDIQSVLKSLNDVLKPGGLFYIAVKEIREGQFEEEDFIRNNFGYEETRRFTYFTLDELKNYLDQLGFLVAWERRELSGKTYWLQVIGKKSEE